jgi:hypothetical protein
MCIEFTSGTLANSEDVSICLLRGNTGEQRPILRFTNSKLVEGVLILEAVIDFSGKFERGWRA